MMIAIPVLRILDMMNLLDLRDSSLIIRLAHDAYIELNQRLRGPEFGHSMHEIVIHTETTGLDP